MKCRKKPLIVDFREVTKPELVTTAHGRVRAEVGDFILLDPESGDTWPIKRDIFEETYEVVDESSGS